MIINRYPITCYVFEPRAEGGIFIGKDKIGQFNKKGSLAKEYRLKKRKSKLDPQLYKNFITGPKGAHVLLLWSPQKDVFEPLQTSIVENEVKGIYQKFYDLYQQFLRKEIAQEEYEKQRDEMFDFLQDQPIKVKGFALTADEVAWKENYMNNVQQAYVLFQRKGWLETYMPLILLFGMGFIMIMALYVVRQDLAGILAQASQTLGNIQGSLQQVKPPI